VVTTPRGRTLDRVGRPGDRVPERREEQAEMNGRPIRLAICARAPAVRAGLRVLLAHAGFEVVDELSPQELAREAPIGADVLMIELSSGDGDLRAALQRELREMPAVVLVEGGGAAPPAAGRAWLPADASEEAIAAAVAGVSAGLAILDPSLPAGGDDAISGGSDGDAVSVTERELEVLALLAVGLSNKAIAHELGISEHTVKYHVGSLLSKLDAQSRTEAVTVAARRGLLTL